MVLRLQAKDLPASRELTAVIYERAQIQAMQQGGLDKWRQVEAEIGRSDLFYLLVRILRRPDISHPWLFDRCREVQADPNGYLDLWHREAGKSSIITFGLTIQDILNDPEITVGIFSHTRPIAKAFLRQIKQEFEGNEILKALYPNVLYQDPGRESPKWSEDDGIIVKRQGNPKEATVEAWGLVDGQPTGRHFRLRVYDDVVTRESVTTPEQIEKTTKAWELSDNLGVQSDQGGIYRMIGTRYSLFDSYAEIIKRGAAKPRLYPATHNGRIDGRPVLFSDEEWKRRLRNQSRPTIASQLLQNPLADEDATFRPEWLRSYEVRPRTLNVYIMADPSRGRSATSDNTAIAVIGISATGGKYFLDGLCHRMTLSQRWLALRGLYRKWSRQPGIQHVAVGYERYGAQSDDEYFTEQMDRDKRNREPNSHFAIEELNWVNDAGTLRNDSKRVRVERLEPDFRNGRFFLPYPVIRNARPTVWTIDSDPDSKSFRDIQYKAIGSPTKLQMQMIEAGSSELLAQAIKGVDQDGRLYDVTLHFIDEYVNFPFGRLKDLVDACSRIYDMSPVTPALATKEQTEPTIYWDS